jgi:FixJ family two-component response regulator
MRFHLRMEEVRPLVAVVDDEESVRRAISRLLRCANYRAEAFDSARKFLESLTQRLPQCLILDLQMPGLGGIELQARLQQHGYGIPVIVITAHDEPGTRERCLAMGTRSYFQKPVEANDLIKAVDDVVNRPEH